MKSKIMKFFSDLGRSLMMPVAALAACGIILGITSALLKTQVQDAVPFLTASVPLFIITTLNKVSGIVFTLLPVLFAISIAFGLAKEDKGVAAFAGFIGYYTFLVASSCMISTGIMDFSAMKISNILGVDTVDMGALAGIMAGLVTAKLHNKYHKVQFPAAIAFYGGKRFVALVVLVSMTVIGLVMPLIWAPISVGIDGLGRIIRSSGAFGVFIFGTLERLLIPTGLHHVLNSLFRTTAIGGTYHGVEGCLNIFLQFLDQAPLSDMKPYTQFLGQGKMPYMLFGLPAAALAGYGREAQKGYINQDDKGVHITGNTDSGYGNAAFYIKLDNGIPDDLTRASAVKFSYVSFKKVVVVPTSIIHKQVNPMDKDDISYYVWKIDGDSVVKQPVILGDYTSGSNTLVLYGIDEGDEICLAS